MIGGYRCSSDLSVYHYSSMYPYQMRLLAALLRTARIWAGLHRNISAAETDVQVSLPPLFFTLHSFLRCYYVHIYCRSLQRIQIFASTQFFSWVTLHSEYKRNDSKDDAIKIIIYIYIYIYILSTDFSSYCKNNDSINDVIKIRKIYTITYIHLINSTVPKHLKK